MKARHIQLTNYIRERILQSSQERLSFSKFMEFALTNSQFGYYQTHSDIFGVSGDFVTAPEVSSVFNYSIAYYCEPILKSLSENAVILEIGAGTGRLAADVLLTLERLNVLPKQYYIIEVSDSLKRQQQRNFEKWIPGLASLIQYPQHLPTQPIEGVVIANEVLDTFPVHCFQLDAKGMHERYVTWKNDHFAWVLDEPSTQALRSVLSYLHLTYLKDVKEYRSEVCLHIKSWFENLSRFLKRGCVLLFDYGEIAQHYYHPQRSQGTLRCYYQHQQYTDPLSRVGLQDITSDVDFSHVAKTAIQSGFEVEAYMSQAAFLLTLNLLELDKKWYDPWEYLKKKGQMHQLLSPDEMGERIKCMVLRRNFKEPLLSLETYNRRDRII